MPLPRTRLADARHGALERKLWLALTVLAFVFLTSIVAQAQAQEKVVRIGYQQYGTSYS